jgi:hypothetical protein
MSDKQKHKLREINIGKTYPLRKKPPIECQCLNCGKAFLSPNRVKRKLCSKECGTAWRSRECKSREGMGRNNNSHAAWYDSPIAGRVWLESSWERQCAEIFDKHQVQWERPKTRFLWIDQDGKSHHYYPDFYLPCFDLYLDPKNPWQQEKDAYKLARVRENHSIKLVILNKEEIKEEALLKMLKELEQTANIASQSRPSISRG